jgi:hypothetical protein
MEISSKLQQYLTRANSLWKLLEPVYDGTVEYLNDQGAIGNVYWPGANALDTIIDYFTVAPLTDVSQAEIDAFMNAVAKNYLISATKPPSYPLKGQANEGVWYDDFAWWGIAGAKAFLPEYDRIFSGGSKNKFQQIAQTSWDYMNKGVLPGQTGAQNVWANCHDPKLASAAPRIKGGVWQNDLSVNCSPLQIPGYKYTALGPYQDAVINGLYFFLGLQLSPEDLNIAALYKFITTWCFDDEVIPVADERWLYFTDNTDAGALIKERIRTYADGSFVNPTCWGANNASWGGDQGLMLGGMVKYLALNPGDKNAIHLIKLLPQGVVKCMTKDYVIQSYYPFDTPYPGSCGGDEFPDSVDPGDYSSGAGVFMRYLLYAYRNNADVKSVVDTDTGGVRTMVQASADAIPTPPTRPSSYKETEFFNIFNQLSILTTAIAILTAEHKIDW